MEPLPTSCVDQMQQKKHQCVACDYSTNDKPNFNKHLKKHHSHQNQKTKSMVQLTDQVYTQFNDAQKVSTITALFKLSKSWGYDPTISTVNYYTVTEDDQIVTENIIMNQHLQVDQNKNASHVDFDGCSFGNTNLLTDGSFNKQGLNLGSIPQHNIKSPVQSGVGIPFSQLGSQITDPSLKAENEFRDKYILRSDYNELKKEKLKLEEKLETNSFELMQLRSQLGGLEVQTLKIELAEATVRLEERSERLVEVKKQLQEWIDTADKLINGRADFEQWRKKLKTISTSQSIISSESHLSMSSELTSPVVKNTDNDESEDYKNKYGQPLAAIQSSDRELVEQNMRLKEAAIKIAEAYDDATIACKNQQHQIQAYHLYAKKLTDLTQLVRKHCSGCNKICTLQEHEQYGETLFGKRLAHKIKSWYMGLRDNQSTIDEHMSWLEEEQGLTVQLRPKEEYPNKPTLESLPPKLEALFPGLKAQLQLTCIDSEAQVNNDDQMIDVKNDDNDDDDDVDDIPKFAFDVNLASNLQEDIDRARALDNQQSIQINTQCDIILPKYDHKSGGSLHWNKSGQLVNVTQALQENNIAKIRLEQFLYRCVSCKKLFSCKEGWIRHKDWMVVCGKTSCVCDVFSQGIYSYSIGTGNKKYQRTISNEKMKKLEGIIARVIKKPELIQSETFKTALETRRDIQRDETLSYINEHSNKLMTIEGWLQALSELCDKFELIMLGLPLCDAIVYPRCFSIFGTDIQEHDNQLKIFLKSHGIPVRSVGNVSTNEKGLAFIYLTDSDNTFTTELIQNLDRSLDDIALQLRSKHASEIECKEVQNSILEAALANLYIRQTDYTRDFLGFFMMLSLGLVNHKFRTLKQIGELIGMQYSKTHSQLMTSIQFESFVDGIRQERLKVYNKGVNLLTMITFKAKLSMGTSKLFKAPLAFHQKKIQPSFDFGFGRIELSNYFNSIKEWKQKALAVDSWELRIQSIKTALHQVQETLIYKVNFKVFWDSFWFAVDNATTLVIFDPDLWTVVYAYSGRSYLFTGHHTDRHNKSGAWLTFLQRFSGERTLVRVSNGTETKEFLIYRHGHGRQIPIDSLNVIQREVYRFPIDLSKWFYNLSQKQLNQVYFTCDEQELFDEWFGQDSNLARSNMNAFENQIDQNMEGEEQLTQVSASQVQQSVNYNKKFAKDQHAVTISPDDNHSRKKKRELKLKGKDQQKQDKQQTASIYRINLNQETDDQWKKNGFNRGEQRWQCLYCKRNTKNKDTHRCDLV